MQQRKDSERKKMEKKMKQLMKDGETDYAAAFPSLDSSFDFDLLSDIVSGAVVKSTILHVWAQDGSFENCIFNGKIEKLKGTVYTICYWGQDKDYEEDGEDYKVQIYELAVDYLCGDVQFL